MGWNEIRLFFLLRFSRYRNDARAILPELHTAMNQDRKRKLSASEKNLLLQIRKKTSECNRNNLTRTKAYLDFYHRHPEVHWSLLAHSVSRNGGYGMTDLKGEFFLRIASEEVSKRFFTYLERVNWLIFHDAYAQMLIYEESKNRNQNLFYLLPSLDVSKFMVPIWNHFWHKRNIRLLTRALIINEQNYIESRVVKNPYFQSTVEASILFHVESFLNLNQVLFPYCERSHIQLGGDTIRHFTSVKDRICTGLRLYNSLFGDEERHRAILRFLNDVPHSGSRADYWPDIFTFTETSNKTTPYHPRLTSGASTRLDSPIYSPKLNQVWPDVVHRPAETGDWFINLKHVIYLFDMQTARPSDITDKYLQSLKVTENLVMAKEKSERILSKQISDF